MKKKDAEGAPRLSLPVTLDGPHKGKVLAVDRTTETITLLGPDGSVAGVVSWATVIDWIGVVSKKAPENEQRRYRRSPILIRIQYRTSEWGKVDGRASGIGGGGLYIESGTIYPVGTKLAMTFALPDRPSEWLEAKGVVAWTCPKADQYTLCPGMGVKFTEIGDPVRDRVIALVESLHNPGLAPKAS